MDLPSSDYMPSQRKHQQYLHQSQLLSPLKTNLPIVEPNVASSTTYYLTQNKSTSKQSRAMLINAYQNSAKGSKHQLDPLEDRSPHFASQTMFLPTPKQQIEEEQLIAEQKERSFKKRHVSTIQDKLHSNTMKNMALIQKQIQANTNMTRNRLAAGKAQNQTMAHLASVRSQTVHMSSRKQPQPQSFYRLTAASGLSTQMEDANIQQQMVTEIDTSKDINFEPLQFRAGNSTFKNQNRNTQVAGLSVENYSTRQSHLLPNPNNRFGDMRRKVGGSHMGKANMTMFNDGRSQKAISDLSKDAISLQTQSQRKQLNLVELSLQQQIVEKAIDDEEGFQTRSLQTQFDQSVQTQKRKSKATYHVLQDQESFLDVNLDIPQLPRMTTPIKQNELKKTHAVLGCSELGGKRMANNLSELQTQVQNSNTEQSQSQQVSQFQGQLNEVSTILSQTSKMTTSKMLGNRQVECPHCRTWKRINQECRNFQLRVNYKDLASVFKFVEDLASIESIQKMAPELSRSLLTLKDNFKCQYAVEKSELNAKVFQLENKLKNMNGLAEKYKSDLEASQVKYAKIQEFIYESRTVTIKKDAHHQAFLNDQTIKDGVVDQAQDQQAMIKYSALDTELTDLKDLVDMQQDHHSETIQMLRDRAVGEKRSKATHITIDEMFDRESMLQTEKAKIFMRDHFRPGKDASAMTFSRACVTVENMISTKKGYPNRAERMQADIEMRKLESMTQIKIENSLLCQSNLELTQQIDDQRLYQIEIEKKLSFFNDLDIKKVRKAQDDYARVMEENCKVTKMFQTSDAARTLLVKDTRRFALYEEQYQAAINASIDFNKDILKQLAEVRREITCEDVEMDNASLQNQMQKLAGAEVDATLKGPAPGSKTITNLFKGHMADQRSAINQSIELVFRVINLSYTYNRPLLASGQAMDEVFRVQKAALHGELKAKFDKLFVDREQEHAKAIEKLEEQHRENSDETKDFEKKGNIAVEALKKMKLELKSALADVQAYKAAALLKPAPAEQSSLPRKKEEPTSKQVVSIESNTNSELVAAPSEKSKREKSHSSGTKQEQKSDKQSTKRSKPNRKVSLDSPKQSSKRVSVSNPSVKSTFARPIKKSATAVESPRFKNKKSSMKGSRKSTGSGSPDDNKIVTVSVDKSDVVDNTITERLDEERESEMSSAQKVKTSTITSESIRLPKPEQIRRGTESKKSMPAVMVSTVSELRKSMASNVYVSEPGESKAQISVTQLETGSIESPFLKVQQSDNRQQSQPTLSFIGVDIDSIKDDAQEEVISPASFKNLPVVPLQVSESRDSRESVLLHTNEKQQQSKNTLLIQPSDFQAAITPDSKPKQKKLAEIQATITQQASTKEQVSQDSVLLETSPADTAVMHHAMESEASSQLPTPKILMVPKNLKSDEIQEPQQTPTLGETSKLSDDVVAQQPEMKLFPIDVQIVPSVPPQSSKLKLHEQVLACFQVSIDDYAFKHGKKEQQTQVKSTEQQTQSTSLIDMEGIEVENPDDARKRRQSELKELAEKFKEHPEDGDVKKKYFEALKQEYGEGGKPAVNPAAVNQYARRSHALAAPRVEIMQSNSYSPQTRQQPHSHISRLQTMVDRTVYKVAAESVSPQRIDLEKQTTIRAGKVERLGTLTAKTRVQFHLLHNSKQVQCDILTSSIQRQPRKPRCIDKQVQTVVEAEVVQRKKSQKKTGKTKLLSSVGVENPRESDKQTGRNSVGKRMMMTTQDQTQTAGQILQSRIFDKSGNCTIESSNNKVKTQSVSPRLKPADSQHALETGIWVQNAISVMPKKSHARVDTVTRSDNSSLDSRFGPNFIFQPVLQAKGKCGRYSSPIKQQQNDANATKQKKESVMLEIKTIEMSNRNAAALSDDLNGPLSSKKIMSLDGEDD